MPGGRRTPPVTLLTKCRAIFEGGSARFGALVDWFWRFRLLLGYDLSSPRRSKR